MPKPEQPKSRPDITGYPSCDAGNPLRVAQHRRHSEPRAALRTREAHILAPDRGNGGRGSQGGNPA